MPVEMFALKWIGQPGQFVAGFPAQDLEVDDVDLAGYLVFGGCYASDDPAVNAIAEDIAATEPPRNAEFVVPDDDQAPAAA